jgi:hypothetical protein
MYLTDEAKLDNCKLAIGNISLLLVTDFALQFLTLIVF